MAKILLYDIETSPILAAVWSRYDSSAVWVESDWSILCIGYHWYGSDEPVQCIARTDFDLYKADPDSDLKVCAEFRKLLDEADITVAHNGDRFDQPKINARLLVHGFDPPRPYKTVDTLKVAKKEFAFSSNRLGDLATALGVEQKGETGGYDTWRRCMAGDPKAWARMIDYCKQDVVVLEQLYIKLRPWMQNHPSLSVIDGHPDACPKCGADGTMLQRRGYHVTKLCRRQRYQCQECGGWSMGRKLLSSQVRYLS